MFWSFGTLDETTVRSRISAPADTFWKSAKVVVKVPFVGQSPRIVWPPPKNLPWKELTLTDVAYSIDSTTPVKSRSFISA